MSDPKNFNPEDALAGASREEIMSAMFANMVIQQANMAMIFLGKVAHPETGQLMQDLEAARMFIDQLEMIEAKTKGNLSKQEEGLLKQALSAARMSFVEVSQQPLPAAGAAPDRIAESPAPEPLKAASETGTASAPKPVETPSVADSAPDESRKKFSKKY